MRGTKNCSGCRNDFYNRATKSCWSLGDAKMVVRFRIASQTAPTQKNAFLKVVRPDCYHRDGYAYYEKLPSCVDRGAVAAELNEGP